MIVIERESGKIKYNNNEIIIFIEEQLKMVPGIINLGKKGLINFLRQNLAMKSSAVRLYQVNKNEVLIEIDLVISRDTCYQELEMEIKKLLTYSLFKKYGIEITSLDIYIQNLV